MENKQAKMTNSRWVIVTLLFFATTVNYLDRQVLSLLQPLLAEEFHWTDNDYGTITAIFSLVYAISMLFAGKIIDKLGTKKGYMWSIIIWSVGLCLTRICHITELLSVGINRTDSYIGY